MVSTRRFLAIAACVLVQLSLGSSGARAQTTRTVQGVVRDSLTGEVLSGAILAIPGTSIGALTNVDGRFTIVGVPIAPQTLEVHEIGYEPMVIQLTAGSDPVALNVRLVTAPVRLSDLVVTVQAQTMDAGQRVSEIRISPAQVAATPSLGEQDIFRTIQLLPGVSTANKGGAGLYVRGGTPDQNLVLLDGMTMYHVDHFFGIFSAFNADAVKDIRFYAGGFPAKYGGRVSSVLDLTGKNGDERTLRGNVGVSLLSGRSVIEIPLGRGSILLSGRRSYTDLVRSGLYNKLFESTAGSTTNQAPQPGGGPPGGGGPFASQTQSLQPAFYFYDTNVKATYRPSEQDLLTLSLYAGSDNLDQSNTVSATFRGGPGGFGGIDAGTGIGNANQGEIRNTDVSQWGNRGASARWFRQWSSRLSSDALAAASNYRSTADRSSTATLTATQGGTGTLGRPSFQERNDVDDVTLRLDNELIAANALTLDFGGSLSLNEVSYDYSQLSADTVLGGITRADEATQTSGYLQTVWSPLARVALTAGVRGTLYDITKTTYLEPRIQASIRVTGGLQLKGAWGRYHQFVTRAENEDVLNGSRDFWLLSDSTLPVTEAEHRIVGMSLDLTNYLFSVEAYDKVLDGLSLFSRRFRRVSVAADYNTLFYTGDGRARGIDVLAQKKFGALTGWLSYSLAKSTETFAEVDEGREFPSSQDQRHDFKAVASYQLGRWTFSSAFAYGSGMPYTSPESQYYLTLLDGSRVGFVHVGDKNAARLPSYHRLDLAVLRRFRLNERFDWEIGGSVFNAYDRANVAYRRFDLSTSPITITDAHTLGMTPSLDVRIILK